LNQIKITNMTTSIEYTTVKELRERKGLSQEELSESAGVSLRTIQRMENGEGVPRGSTLRNIASSLGVSSDYFSTVSSEGNDSAEAESNESKATEFRIPWYLIGCTIVGGALGFIAGLLLMLTGLLPGNNIGGTISVSLAILLGAVGLLIGNYIERRSR